jgi:delta-aminolevulinic acid dehydratase/porphobilinogen synthase
MRRRMAGICEARDKMDRELYRLFCVLDRRAGEYGLGGPTLAVLDGAVKDVRTVMDDDVYEQVLLLRDDYLGGNPRPVAPSDLMDGWIEQLSGRLPIT